MSRGEFDRLIAIQRGVGTSNDYGDEVLVWTTIAEGWAKVRFGTAQEKREAAQEAGLQSATFELIPNTALLGVVLKDKILFDNSEWDVTEVAPLNRNLIRFTAARSQ